MVFTTANGAGVYAQNDENVAGVLAAGNNDTENKNVGNGVAEDLDSKATGDGDSRNSVAKREDKKVFIKDAGSSDSSSDVASKVVISGASAAVGGIPFGVAGYLGGKAKGKNDSNSGVSSNSDNGSTTAGNNGASNNVQLEKLENELAEAEKLLEDSKYSASWITILGWWSLLIDREHIGKERVIATSVLHGIFLVAGIVQLFWVFACKANSVNRNWSIPSAIAKMICPLGAAVDVFKSVISPTTQLGSAA